MKYDFKTVEAKWQKVWEDEDTFHADIDHSKPKFYALVEFPYPSAAGLHVGHPRSYTALDIVARKKRQCGYNVLYPMGWDAFGLPTENYALKNHINPEIVTAQNVARFKSQLKALGLSFDWDREINTTDPSTTSGPSGSLSSSSKRAWLIRKRPPSTTAPAARSCWPTRKSSTAFASAAAALLCRKTRASGCSRSPLTRTA